MRYELWAPRYEALRADLGYPFEREELAAATLERLLPDRARRDPLARLAPRVVGRTVVVVGLAPGAGPPPVWRLPPSTPAPSVVAADGAARTCLDAGLVPSIVVTDLDGPVPAEVEANGRGAVVVVHAHGDNVPALERWVPEFPGELAGSWAGPPRGYLLDVGGFTDGDRAAYLADALGARRVLLWGFDRDTVDEADPEARERKRRKLRWAERLLEELARDGQTPLFRWRRDGSLVPLQGASTSTT
ncbi:MAG TPA: 6-hydroxymethylpterin diphosphokinase MptE-like protein [Thermoplasmata archaeon]|nr:6-hydroxymethylpterin diphosphokinase MptE-like protein [Thermoplasmata archaeon]